jgi:hypothetical protein
MATINNLMSNGLNTSAIRNTQNQMSELRNQYRGKEIDSDEYREAMAALRDQHEDARLTAAAAGANVASNISNLFNYMNNSSNNGAPSIWGGGTFDQSAFFGGQSELSTLQAMNSARIGIENRARTLVGEIGRDRARGLDVSERQEALSNLTGNLDILNRNLSSSIDRALSDNERSGNFVDMVSRIRQSLAPTPTEEVDETETNTTVTAPETSAAAAPEAPATAPEAEAPQPSFAAPSAFEGSAAEQVVAASQEPEEDEMSIAAQIASSAQSQYSESVNIMADDSDNANHVETPQEAAEAAMLAQAQGEVSDRGAEIPQEVAEMGVA